MSTPNVALLRQTLAHIEAHPEQWNQEMWANECGTAFCFAGHAVLQAGCHILASRETVEWSTIPSEIATAAFPLRGSAPSIRAVAMRLLGLDDGQALTLFCGDNSLDDLERIVDDLCAESAEAVTS